jgi:hypothetical protein
MSAFSYPLQKQRESKREWSAPSLFHIPAIGNAALLTPDPYHKGPLLPLSFFRSPLPRKKAKKAVRRQKPVESSEE